MCIEIIKLVSNNRKLLNKLHLTYVLQLYAINMWTVRNEKSKWSILSNSHGFEQDDSRKL